MRGARATPVGKGKSAYARALERGLTGAVEIPEGAVVGALVENGHLLGLGARVHDAPQTAALAQVARGLGRALECESEPVRQPANHSGRRARLSAARARMC